MRCAEGTNPVTVHMTAAPGVTIGLTQPVVTRPSVDAKKGISLNEGDAFVVGITDKGTAAEYWVRCLPHDFPLLSIAPHADAGAPTPGYYLVGDVVLAAGETGYAIVLDSQGVPVWYHTTKAGPGAVDVDNLIAGTISYCPNLPNTYGTVSGQFELHALAAHTTTYLEPVGEPLDMHELRILKNGDYLVFADPITRGEDLTGLSTFGPQEDVLGCTIQELTPSGDKVWEWNIENHFKAVESSTWPQIYPVDGKTVVDPYHCNAIDVADNGDLLVSARHMDSVFMVSRTTGKVLWKMGGTTASQDDAPYIALVDDPLTSFHRQHDVRILPDGTISMFDDQTATAGPARALIVSYDVAAGTAKVAWQYQGTMTSLAMGSFRILEDGSRVIGWGVGWGILGPSNRAFTEVDEAGNDLLDFGFPDGDDSYRAIKIPLSSFDIGLFRATAGKD